jgi:hypothetical protein
VVYSCFLRVGLLLTSKWSVASFSFKKEIKRSEKFFARIPDGPFNLKHQPQVKFSIVTTLD